MSTSKKQNIDLSSNGNSHTQLNSSRSKELSDLKRSIRDMQEGKRREERKQQQLGEKQRLVDQIKNRYRSGEDSLRKSTASGLESDIERIDVSNTFERDCERTSEQKDGESAEKGPAKKAIPKQATQTTQPKEMRPGPQSASKGHVITSEDYDDVLDLMNCNNF